MGDEEECNTGLCLALAVGAAKRRRPKDNNNNNNNKQTSMVCLDLSCKREAGDVDKGHKVTKEDGLYVNKNNFDSSNNNCGKRKLRLTKDQSRLLEDTFKLHTTLNSTQKHALAEQLHLKPRQVEVWFQNRRARTKLKQTEIDCEILKKCCERLSDENKRLKKELQELLQSVKAGASPLIIQVQKGTMCSACQKIMRTK